MDFTLLLRKTHDISRMQGGCDVFKWQIMWKWMEGRKWIHKGNAVPFVNCKNEYAFDDIKRSRTNEHLLKCWYYRFLYFLVKHDGPTGCFNERQANGYYINLCNSYSIILKWVMFSHFIFSMFKIHPTHVLLTISPFTFETQNCWFLQNHTRHLKL